MPAKYNVIPRKNPQDRDAPPKYYASFVSSGRTSTRKMAERIAALSTVSSIDTLAVIEALLQVIPQELAEGNIIDLGEFGSFRLRVQSEGSDTAEEVTSRNIKKVKVQFYPGKEIKQTIENTTFEKNSG